MTDIEIRSRDDAPVTPEALAQMGGGRVAYMKPLKADEEPGRHDPCPCGSGKKYKKCCGLKKK